MARPHSRKQRKAPRRFTLNTRSHSSIVISSNDALPPTPALNTATSRLPRGGNRPGDAVHHLLLDGDIDPNGEIRVRCVGQVEHRDPGPRTP